MLDAKPNRQSPEVSIADLNAKVSCVCHKQNDGVGSIRHGIFKLQPLGCSVCVLSTSADCFVECFFSSQEDGVGNVS